MKKDKDEKRNRPIGFRHVDGGCKSKVESNQIACPKTPTSYKNFTCMNQEVRVISRP